MANHVLNEYAYMTGWSSNCSINVAIECLVYWHLLIQCGQRWHFDGKRSCSVSMGNQWSQLSYYRWTAYFFI